jgi:hypothetical protein
MLLLAGLIMGGLAAPAGAQPVEPGNAAYWYRRASEQHEHIRAAMTERERRSVDQAIDDQLRQMDQEPSDALRFALARFDPVLTLALRGAEQDRCDFDLDYSLGLDLELPHYDNLRLLSRWLAVEGLVHLHDGDAPSAARRIGAIYRTASHAGQDRLLLSSMLGKSLFDFAERVTQHTIDRGRIGPLEARALLQAIETIDPTNPMSFVEGMASEKTVVLAWTTHRYSGEGGVELARAELGWDDKHPVISSQLAAMSQDELNATLAAAKLAADRAIETLVLSDPDQVRAELGRIDDAVAKGEYGVIATVLFGHFSDAFERFVEVRRALRARAEMLEAIADGRRAPTELANAAYWYRRATRTFDQLPEQQQQLIRGLADDHGRSINDETAEALDAAEETIEILLELRRIPRCDFDDERRSDASGICDYHAELRGLVDLLHADAIRRIRAEEYDAAVARLAACYRIASHLSDDPLIFSAVLAHATFDATQSLLAPGLATDAFSFEQRKRLLAAARDVGYRDPFGYAVSITAQRDAVQQWLETQLKPGDVDAAQRLAHIVDTCDGDQVLFLAIAIDQATTEAAPGTGPRFNALAGVLALTEAREALQQAKQTLEVLPEGRLERLAEPSAPRFASVVERMSRAQDELRDALIALRGEQTEAIAN